MSLHARMCVYVHTLAQAQKVHCQRSSRSLPRSPPSRACLTSRWRCCAAWWS